MDDEKKKRLCTVPGCGRPLRAMGLCQTHYKHKRKHGKLLPIKVKRPPREVTVKYAGLSLTPEAADVLKRESRRLNIAPNALITDIVEAWTRRRR